MYPGGSPGASAYDRALTVFSPQGHLYQVEYAEEAVKQGNLAIALKFKDGIVFATQRQMTSNLIVPESLSKIYLLEDRIVAEFSGLTADARQLVNYCREWAEEHRIVYNEEIPIDKLAKKLADLMQAYTQYGGARPFGVSFILGGSKDSKVIEIKPMGTIVEYNAVAIGFNYDKVNAYFEKNYKPDLDQSTAVQLIVDAVNEVQEKKGGKKLEAELLEVAFLDSKTGKFRHCTKDECDVFLKAPKKK